MHNYELLKENITHLNVPNLKLIRSKANTGFASGNMYGVQQASGEFLAFVNNDVVLIEDSFSYPIEYLNKNLDVGVLGLQPIFENGEMHGFVSTQAILQPDETAPTGHQQRLSLPFLGNYFSDFFKTSIYFFFFQNFFGYE